MHGEFTWVDLSTFDLTAAQEFYGAVLSWRYRPDRSGYTTCSASGRPCAAIFEMPQKFQDIGMPSFWMTYIEVEDIQTTIDNAIQMGGRLELQEDSRFGKTALLRDPLGAGFTCYQGKQKSARSATARHGTWFWNELYVSSGEPVIKFYETLFRWQIVPQPEESQRFQVLNSVGTQVAAMQETDEELRSGMEFWAVYFAVANLADTCRTISDHGGTFYASPLGERSIAAATDPQGAAFFLSQTA